MNKNHVEEIKKEDKKAFKGYATITVVCGIIGAILGAMSDYLKEILGESIPNLLMSIFEIITPFVSIVLSIVLIIVSKIVYNKSRKEYDLWSQTSEDDEVIDKIEERLSYVLLFTSVNIILGLFFFGIGGALLIFDKINEGFNIINALCLLAGLILCMTSSKLIQKNIVNWQKEINPLLKGSVYDMKFREKWLDSCDEAIKLGIFKSAYKAYKSVYITCAMLWLFCFIGYTLWDLGVMPMVIVTIILLVQTVSYCMESIKQSKVK